MNRACSRLFLLLTVFADSEIQSLFDRLMAADNRGDVDSVVACYADDAVLLPPGRASVQCTENIRPRYEALFAESQLQVRMEVDAIEVRGPLAFSRGVTRGQMIPKDGSPPREIADRYLMVLRHDGEAGWKIAALMWDLSPRLPHSLFFGRRPMVLGASSAVW